jgi:hypothetical protein
MAMETGNRVGVRTRAAWLSALATAVLCGGVVLPSSADAAGARITAAVAPAPTSIGLLGDVPYGSSQRSKMAALIRAINSDPQISLVLHAGDTKSGTEACSNSFYADRFTLFNTFADPFVLTPGDNDWTDCHTSSAGRYVPTERLAKLRATWYPTPGRTLGATSLAVTYQNSTYRENVRFTESGVVVGTVHIVGSGNDLNRWSGLSGGDKKSTRLAEFNARRKANLAWINATFDAAARSGAPGVLLLMQAEPTTSSGFSQERSLILKRAKAFGKPVLLVHGDEHKYEVQTKYGGVANLTRLETYGATTGHWLKVTIDPGKAGMSIFSWASMKGV